MQSDMEIISIQNILKIIKDDEKLYYTFKEYNE
jgi:hypothetical protein